MRLNLQAPSALEKGKHKLRLNSPQVQTCEGGVATDVVTCGMDKLPASSVVGSLRVYLASCVPVATTLLEPQQVRGPRLIRALPDWSR